MRFQNFGVLSMQSRSGMTFPEKGMRERITRAGSHAPFGGLAAPAGEHGGELPEDDQIVFADEAEAEGTQRLRKSLPTWRVLLADDDEEVHHATEFALRGVQIDGRMVELLHASSALEAEGLLAQESHIAVAMLDVVMETTDAGLTLVEIIREKLGLKNLRIVLRTGQPGYAPELEVIQRYDINDYRTKSELTQIRLITALTSAIRAYAQLEQIAQTGRGMAGVSRASGQLFQVRAADEFARCLLARIAEVLGTEESGFVCADPGAQAGEQLLGMHVIAASGAHGNLVGMSLQKIANPLIQRLCARCIASRTMASEEGMVAIWLGSSSRDAMALFDAGHELSETACRLLELLAGNAAVGFENVDLFERLDFFAFFDPLTRLSNRTRFLSEVDQDLFSRPAASRCMAIADVVRFSDINDALGHRCGDTLLIGVAKRLRAAVGAEVFCARISADVFALFGPENAIDPVAIRRAFESPFFVHGHALTVQMRMGLVRVADTRGAAADFLRCANLALNQARQLGGGASCYFARSMSEDVQVRVSMLHSLRAAIDFKRGLSLAYQPQIDARTGGLLGAEALLRWRNDFGEMVSPAEFIPLAERTGLINELGLWVIECALDQLARWRALGLSVGSISVNVSSVQFRTEDFALRVRKLVDLCDVPPELLTLEITESIVLEDHEQVMTQIDALRAAGIRFAIDDFGTGFSSLSQVARLPADQLKIDRAFVACLDNSAADRALAGTVVMLGKARDMQLVAEGVETAAQRDALLEMGCEKMQGYYFARPMNAEQFEEWARQQAGKKTKTSET